MEHECASSYECTTPPAARALYVQPNQATWKSARVADLHCQVAAIAALHICRAGSPVAYGRDQHIRVEFKTLARALHKIAKGQIESRPNNFAARLFNMTQNVPCPTQG
jgi:hypothetical protein